MSRAYGQQLLEVKLVEPGIDDGRMLPGMPGHDAKRPVVSGGGAKPEPCGPPPGVMTGTPDNGEITVVLGGTGATPED